MHVIWTLDAKHKPSCTHARTPPLWHQGSYRFIIFLPQHSISACRSTHENVVSARAFAESVNQLRMSGHYYGPMGVYMMLRLGKTSRDCCANGSRSTNASSVSAKFGSPRDCYMDRHHRSWRMGSMFEGNKSCCNCQKSRRSDAYWYSMLRLMLLLHFLTTTCSDDYRNSLLWWLWTTQAFPIMASVAVQHMASQLWIPSIP